MYDGNNLSWNILLFSKNNQKKNKCCRSDKMKSSKSNEEETLPNFFPMYCEYCGNNFGKNLIALGTHIGKIHDKQNVRKKQKKQKR